MSYQYWAGPHRQSVGLGPFFSGSTGSLTSGFFSSSSTAGLWNLTL